METMKKWVKVGTAMHMAWRNCMRGFWWCHNTDILIYLIYGKGLQANPIQCKLCICGKRVQKNSVNNNNKNCLKSNIQCIEIRVQWTVHLGSSHMHVKSTICIKWIPKRCSGLCGDLSLLADGFRCTRCDGTLQEVDLAGGLVVAG